HTRSKRDWSSDVCSSDLARLDADDVALPERLARQVRLFEEPRIGLAGCGFERATAEVLLPARDGDLRRRLLLRNLFAHGSVVFQIGRASCRERGEALVVG